MAEKSPIDSSQVVGSHTTGSRPPARRHKHGRSRITNGTALLPDVDGRSPWVRRVKDIIAAHLSDLGGEDNTSAAERSIVRRAATLTVELERLEGKFALAGEADRLDLDLYQRPATCAACSRPSACSAALRTSDPRLATSGGPIWNNRAGNRPRAKRPMPPTPPRSRNHDRRQASGDSFTPTLTPTPHYDASR
jgi:hypothetical protein